MNIEKQHIVLNLIRCGKYEFDHNNGTIISNVWNESRVLRPIKLPTGYLEYQLDLGFGHRVNVYGQGFAYLATYLQTYDPKFVIDHIDGDKSNNKPSNIRCITQRENTKGNLKNRGGGRKLRLPIDHRIAIIDEWQSSKTSFVKLAKKFHVTRQTISKICKSC